MKKNIVKVLANETVVGQEYYDVYPENPFATKMKLAKKSKTTLFFESDEDVVYLRYEGYITFWNDDNKYFYQEKE